MKSAEVLLPSGFAQDSLQKRCSYEEKEKRPCCEAVSQTYSGTSYCDTFGLRFSSFRVMAPDPDQGSDMLWQTTGFRVRLFRWTEQIL